MRVELLVTDIQAHRTGRVLNWWSREGEKIPQGHCDQNIGRSPYLNGSEGSLEKVGRVCRYRL